MELKELPVYNFRASLMVGCMSGFLSEEEAQTFIFNKLRECLMENKNVKHDPVFVRQIFLKSVSEPESIDDSIRDGKTYHWTGVVII